jgi:type VI secretion system secreted protein VgrG
VQEIVDAVLATYGGRVPQSAKTLAGSSARREYVVQYGETDWSFLCRILADNGIASYFDHAHGSAWTLVDDTSAMAPEGPGAPIPFVDPTQLATLATGAASTPHVLTAVVKTGIETSAVTIRDFDFTKPDYLLQAKNAAEAGEAEEALEAYTFEVGQFDRQADGDARAARLLEADRCPRRRIACTASFALPPGVRISLTDHPRADLCTELLVVSARTVMEGDTRGTHELELLDLTTRYRPARLPKPRIAGTQTAMVVGAEGEEIDVDKHGRVLVEFRWDRRDQHAGAPSRRVRVAQGWAGADRGFVTLPRIKDEVIVAYLDGDPDEPIVVGRVHNGVSTSPLNLPADKAISVWRTKSTPGGAGFNQILLDDAAGAERMDLHAQRDFRSDTGRNSTTTVGNDQELTVQGNQKITITGSQTVSVKGAKRLGVAGGTFVDGHDMTINGKKIMVDATHVDVGASEIVLHSEGTITLMATSIKLDANGSTFEMNGDEIVLKSPMIKLNP